MIIASQPMVEFPSVKTAVTANEPGKAQLPTKKTDKLRRLKFLGVHGRDDHYIDGRLVDLESTLKLHESRSRACGTPQGACEAGDEPYGADQR